MLAPDDRFQIARLRRIVTDHAVKRWIERVNQIDLSMYARPAHKSISADGETILWYARCVGIDLDLLRAQIGSYSVLRAITLGASRHREGKITRVIENGRVVTVQLGSRSVERFAKRLNYRHPVSRAKQRQDFMASLIGW